MAQSVEHVIGNDEVISSILISSSKNPSIIGRRIFLFCIIYTIVLSGYREKERK